MKVMYSCKPIRLKSSHMFSPKELTPVAKQTHWLKNSQDLNLKASTPRDLLEHIKSAIFKHCTSLPNVSHFSASCKHFSWSSAAQMHLSCLQFAITQGRLRSHLTPQLFCMDTPKAGENNPTDLFQIFQLNASVSWPRDKGHSVHYKLF